MTTRTKVLLGLLVFFGLGGIGAASQQCKAGTPFGEASFERHELFGFSVELPEGKVGGEPRTPEGGVILVVNPAKHSGAVTLGWKNVPSFDIDAVSDILLSGLDSPKQTGAWHTTIGGREVQQAAFSADGMYALVSALPGCGELSFFVYSAFESEDSQQKVLHKRIIESIRCAME